MGNVLLQDEQAGEKECIPECVLERYGDREGVIFEVIGLDVFLEPEFIQVDKFIVAMAN